MARTPETFQEPWFRLICSVGFALLRRRHDIFLQTDDEEGRDWLNVIGLLESACFLAQQQGIGSEPDYLVQRAKEDFAKIAERFGQENPGLRDVLRDLAEELRPLSYEEVLASFQELNNKGLILTQECAADWGMGYATSRASKLKAYKLVFDQAGTSGGTTPVCTWTDTSSRAIHFMVGSGKRPLVSFLCFEFYLLHEYLSHVLPTWEDGAGRLSEGYLFSVARWWYTKKVDHMDSALVAVDWQEHWERQGLELDAAYWRKFHHRSDWFEARSSKGWFASLLLEVAAFRDSAKSGFQPQFLSFLKEIYRGGLGDEVEKVSSEPSLTVEAVYDRFKARLRGRIDPKTLKRLKL